METTTNTVAPGAPEEAGVPGRERAEALFQAGEEALEKLRDQRARLVAEEQIRRIRELDRDIGGMEDLVSMPEFRSFYALVKKGVSLVDAYKLVRYDSLMQRAADAAARQAMRSIGSRSHLTAMAGQPGAGDFATVPAEIAAEYRLARPGITDKEIRRRYHQYKKYKRQ